VWDLRSRHLPGAGGWFKLDDVHDHTANILVVEDDADIRDALKDLLSSEGYSVATAVNGADALDALGTLPEPCVIVLDLMMPVMDGVEFLKQLTVRDGGQLRHKVLVASASKSAADEVQRFGVQTVMNKPFVVSHLLREVERATSSA
jgi:CheY-like chemotaxis protein